VPVRTCSFLVCVSTGTHCKLLPLQQPEQRCTSTQGGHSMKWALLRFTMSRVTSTTSVRTLHRACWAGWASDETHGRGDDDAKMLIVDRDGRVNIIR